jgi:hypothetical protein
MHQQRRRPDRNTRLAQTLDHCDKAQWRLHWRPVNVFCKINSFLKRKHTVCRTSEMTHVYSAEKRQKIGLYKHNMLSFHQHLLWLCLTLHTEEMPLQYLKSKCGGQVGPDTYSTYASLLFLVVFCFDSGMFEV